MAKKDEYTQSGLFKKKRYPPRGRVEADPTRRIREGKGAIVDYEELSKGRKRRKEPKPWANIGALVGSDTAVWDDFATALGVAFLQDQSLESVDEIAGLLTAALPGEKDIGPRGKAKTRVGFGDVRESQRAIRALLNKYKEEYPGADMTGRALSVIFSILTLGGSTAVVPFAAMMARYGLKGTLKLARTLNKVAEVNPKILKLAKKPKQMASKALETLNKTPQLLKETGKVMGEVAVSETMASEEEGLEALAEGLTSPGTLVSTGLVVGPYTARKAGGAVKRFTERTVDLAKDWIPSLPKGVAKLKLKVQGYSNEAIDFIEKNKGFFQGGAKTNPSTALENFREFIEKAANSKESLSEMAKSRLARNIPSFDKESLIKEINEQILKLFKDPKYKPSFADDPGAENVFQLDKLDYDQLKSLLGAHKTSQAASSDRLVATAISAAEETKKRLKKKPTPRQGIGALDRNYGDYAKTKAALKKKDKKEIEDLLLKDYEDPYGKTKEAYPEEAIKIGGTQREIPATQADQSTVNGRYYYSKKQIEEMTEYLDEYRNAGSDGGKLLNDLLALREQIFKTKGSAARPDSITDVQLVRIKNQIDENADFSREWAEKQGSFKTKKSVNSYMSAFAQLSNRVNKLIAKHHPKYAERMSSAAAWNKAAKGGPRARVGTSFNELFGINYNKTYIDGTDGEYIITVSFEGDGEKTLSALEEALIVKSKPFAKEYQEAFKNFVNESLNTIKEAKRLQKVDKKPPLDESKLYSENKFLEGVEKKAFGKAKPPLGEEKSFGPYTPSPDLMRDEVSEELRKNLATGRFYNASAANALMRKILRGPHGEKTVELTGVGRLSEDQTAGAIRRALATVLPGGSRPFLFMAQRGLKKKLSKPITIDELTKEAKEWNQEFEKDPSRLLGYFKIPYTLFTKMDQVASPIGRNIKDVQDFAFPEDKKEEFQPVYRGPQEAGPSIDAFQPAPAVEKLAPQEFIEEETLEVENPEAKDRELRKDRINAFLKQQGAYKRSKRRQSFG